MAAGGFFIRHLRLNPRPRRFLLNLYTLALGGGGTFIFFCFYPKKKAVRSFSGQPFFKGLSEVF
jgi:hypothetical protein